MIEHLSGSVLCRTEKSIVVDVNGVGYGIEIPETLHSHSIEVGDEIRVWIHTYVREDAIRLFGFRSFEEKQIFNLLISVSDVGPKLAMAVLSNVDIATLVHAIDTEDVAIIEEVPGIGPRKSKKMLMELKPKLERLLNSGVLKLGHLNLPQSEALKTGKQAQSGKVQGAKGPQLDRATLLDLKSALSNLGYREKEFLPIIRKLEAAPPSTDLGELIKAALTELSTGGRSEVFTKDPSKLQEIF
jgi:Holliday junction DNA helicase RuvA